MKFSQPNITSFSKQKIGSTSEPIDSTYFGLMLEAEEASNPTAFQEQCRSGCWSCRDWTISIAGYCSTQFDTGPNMAIGLCRSCLKHRRRLSAEERVAFDRDLTLRVVANYAEYFDRDLGVKP